MVRCLGYRFSTPCRHLSRTPQQAPNWLKWQLCYECAKLLHPKYYKNKKHHGVRKLTEPKMNNFSIFNKNNCK